MELKLRASKRRRIEEFFLAHLGERCSSNDLHRVFGPSFRTRVSEINRDEYSPIRILNQTKVSDAAEHSVYWGELKLVQSQKGLFSRGSHEGNP